MALREDAVAIALDQRFLRRIQMIAKQAMSLIEEFKNFAFKGNVVDLAVGVIIGGAFGKLVDALVKSVIMPAVSLALPGDQAYTEWVLTVGGKAIPYGQFLGEVVNFLIVAAALFLLIRKFLGWMVQTKAEAQPAAPTRTMDQQLLTEIRDLLQQRPA